MGVGIFLREPDPRRIRDFLEEQRQEAFSYPEVGRTREGLESRELPGYDVDHNRVRIGGGDGDFENADRALRGWEMFPAPWTRVEPAAPIREGEVVAVLMRLFGLWWLNAARIVYVLDETEPLRRYGFAYGTLPGHAERGEERFSVELHEDGTVWYDLLAFSRPRHPLARLGYPVARRLQRRFVRGSKAAMREAVAAARNRKQ